MSRRVILGLLVFLAVLTLAGMVYSVNPRNWSVRGGKLYSPWAAGTAYEEATARSEETLTVTGPVKLTLKNYIGGVTVLGAGDTDKVKVGYEIKAYGADKEQAEGYLESLKPGIVQIGNAITVSVKPAVRRGGPVDQVELVVSVPAATDVEIDSRLGHVTVRGIRGNVTAEAGMGSIEVTGVVGSLDLQAKMGRIQIREAEVTERLFLDAAMGSIAFQGRLGVENRVTAKMGSVSLQIPPDPALSFTGEVGLGRVNMDLPFKGTNDGRHFNGVIGSGEPSGSLSVYASMGSVDIRAGGAG